MPETRYIETYGQGTGKLLYKTAYEVSDEELAAEKKGQRQSNILDEIDDLDTRLKAVEGKK